MKLLVNIILVHSKDLLFPMVSVLTKDLVSLSVGKEFSECSLQSLEGVKLAAENILVLVSYTLLD